MVGGLERITAAARVPDELIHYVASVAGLESRPVPGGVLHTAGDQGVLVCYAAPERLDAAVDEVVGMGGLERLTVLAQARPKAAPAAASISNDWYWRLNLPMTEPGGKTGNMLRRARRDVRIEAGSQWSREHEKLAADFCKRKSEQLDPGSRYIFGRLGDYLAAGRDTLCFSAYGTDGSLQACAIGDYASLGTAFYMFAFRRAEAVPGAADLLLWEIVRQANERGHSQLNLGLGIDQGVEFFKSKWGAERWLELVETSWTIAPARKGFFARLFGRA